MVNQNFEPSPMVLSTPISPSILSASSEQMDRPSPVPPKRRVVVSSAWLNLSKIYCCLSSGMPMPVSSTGDVKFLFFHLFRFLGLDAEFDVAALGEFNGVAG